MEKSTYDEIMKKALRSNGRKGAKSIILNRIAKGDVDLAAAAIVYGIEAKKTPPPTKKKERFTVKLIQLPLVAMILCVLMASAAHAVSPFEAMPFHTKSMQQVAQGMAAEEDFVDRSIKEKRMDDDTARLFFVFVIDDVMTKCRYSLDKTILKIAKEGLSDEVLNRMRGHEVDGILGCCFQVLQKKGLGERAVAIGVFSKGTLRAVRDTNMGKNQN